MGKWCERCKGEGSYGLPTPLGTSTIRVECQECGGTGKAEPAESEGKPFEPHYVSVTCGGEVCYCGKPATHKVGEEIADDDPLDGRRHNFTQYVCCDDFRRIMGNAVFCSPTAPPDTKALDATEEAKAFAERLFTFQGIKGCTLGCKAQVRCEDGLGWEMKNIGGWGILGIEIEAKKFAEQYAAKLLAERDNRLEKMEAALREIVAWEIAMEAPDSAVSKIAKKALDDNPE